MTGQKQNWHEMVGFGQCQLFWIKYAFSFLISCVWVRFKFNLGMEANVLHVTSEKILSILPIMVVIKFNVIYSVQTYWRLYIHVTYLLMLGQYWIIIIVS